MTKEFKENRVMEAIADRYSCRDFEDKLPEREILESIAKAAVMAPSARNRQPWRIILLSNKDLIADLEKEAMYQLEKSEDKTLYNTIIDRGGLVFYQAPAMIIIPIDPAPNFAQVDCGIVCQNITLAATSYGLGSVICGMAGLAFIDEAKAEEFKKRLQFPKGFEFGCAVLLGYAGKKEKPHKPDLDKIIRIDK